MDALELRALWSKRNERYARWKRLVTEPEQQAVTDVVNLVSGMGPLQHLLDGLTPQTRPDANTIARIGAAMARAAHSLHKQNTCHLDLKPANVLLHPDGHVVLLDFGLSCHAHYPDLLAEELRKAVGSPAWIAPEQVVGVRGDPRSDIFAIGVMLYELATGELPFGNPQTSGGMRQRIVGGEIAAGDIARPPQQA